jgi:tripartite-type tricarboxylate transporter receptor subunit TctC
MRGCAKVLAVAAWFAATSMAHAQAYPNKPVRILVGYAPGGGELWGSTVIIENRPGAAGNVATEIAAKAPPDGYTLVLCNIATHGITPARFGGKLSYDTIGDFAFPSMIGGVPNVFMVHPSMPAQNLKQFIAYAKAHPGKLNFGSSGVGASPHMSIELLKTMTGINIIHVPYKGAAIALADVMSGHIESSVGNLAGGPLAAIKAGRLRALGVTSAKRNPQAPDVPTFAEAGVPGFEVTGWYGICTQSKVPQPILTRLNQDLHKVLNGPALRKRLEDQGVEVRPSTPEEFVAHVKKEIAKWTQVVRDAKLPGE